MSYPRSDICAGILAGGKATRMGGDDKGLVTLAGRPMVCYVMERLRPQAGKLLINANRNREAYSRWGAPVVADHLDGFLGPLAGIAALMTAASTRYLLFAPCDSPRVPADLGRRLYRALQDENAEVAAASSGERLEPVFALMQCRLLPDLEAAVRGGERKIDRWYATRRRVTVDFSDCAAAFANVNSPDERAAMEAEIERQEAGDT